MVAASRFVAALAIVLASAGLAAQDSLVPVVPWDFPQPILGQLEAVRAPILTSITAYDQRVVAFRGQCTTVTSQSQYDTCAKLNGGLDVTQKSIDLAIQDLAARIARAASLPCMAEQRQIERDKQALRLQLKSIEQGVNELEELKKSTEEARKDALLLGVKNILKGVASYLTSQQQSAAAFQGWLTRYDAQLRSRKVPVDVLLGKIQLAQRGYVVASLEVQAGAALDKGLSLAALWKRVNTVHDAIQTGISQGQATFREFLSDPTLRPLILDDATVSGLVRTLVDIGAPAALGKFSPQYTVAAFVVDAGFEIKKFETLRDQIMQRYNLTDRMLEAVEALKQQMERSVAKLQACRAVSAAAK